jgi:hypothetical protein
MTLMPPTLEQIDAILPFLDKFEESKFSAGAWKIEEGNFPSFTFDEMVMEFVQVLYDHEWVNPNFDWTEWQESAKQYVDSPEMIESADTMTIQKLLTTHARADRFCEGHLESMFKNGHILALLRRLQMIRSEMKRAGTHE